MPSIARQTDTLHNLADNQLRQFAFAASIADPSQNDCPLVWCNDRFCALVGYSKDEVLGRNCRFLQGHENIDTSLIKQNLDEEKNFDFLIKNFTKSGTPFNNFVSIRFLRFRGHKLICASQGSIDAHAQGLRYKDLRIFDHKASEHVQAALTVAELSRITALKSWSLMLQGRLHSLMTDIVEL